jgi:hypothetical protein
MTNSRKEAILRYKLGDEPEIKEIKISEDDTPNTVLL